MMHQVKH